MDKAQLLKRNLQLQKARISEMNRQQTGVKSINGIHQDSIQKRKDELRAVIAQFHIDIKGIENHIKQLAEVHSSQRQIIETKKAELKVILEKHANAQSRLLKLQLQKARLNGRTHKRVKSQ